MFNLIARLRRQREGGQGGPEEEEGDEDDENELMESILGEAANESENESDNQNLSAEDASIRLQVAAELRGRFVLYGHSIDSIFRANEAFKEHRYVDALEEYDEAIQELEFTTTSSEMEERKTASKLTCLLNAAACCLKLEDYDRVVADCSTVLAAQPGKD